MTMMTDDDDDDDDNNDNNDDDDNDDDNHEKDDNDDDIFFIKMKDLLLHENSSVCGQSHQKRKPSPFKLVNILIHTLKETICEK